MLPKAQCTNFSDKWLKEIVYLCSTLRLYLTYNNNIKHLITLAPSKVLNWNAKTWPFLPSFSYMKELKSTKEIQGQDETKHQKNGSILTQYLIAYFALVKNSVQVTAICNLFSIHRCYDITQNKSPIGIAFGGLQTLQSRDSCFIRRSLLK